LILATSYTEALEAALGAIVARAQADLVKVNESVDVIVAARFAELETKVAARLAELKDGIDGKDGRDGIDGKDGAPGERGFAGAPVVTMDINDDGLLTLTNADGSTVTADFYPLLSRLKGLSLQE